MKNILIFIIIIICLGLITLMVLNQNLALAPVDSNILVPGTTASSENPVASSTPNPEPHVPPSDSGTITLHLNETGESNGIKITPRAILEDSRCPSDVQCIQAGTVRITATLTSGLGTGTQEFKLGQPITTEAETVVLQEVRPIKVSTIEVKPSDYVFVFLITKR
jgi:hypothetical protein